MRCSDCRYFDLGCTESRMVDLIGSGPAGAIPGDFPGCGWGRVKIGRLLPVVDALPRDNVTWGYGISELEGVRPARLDRLECDLCLGLEFEVLRAGGVQAVRCSGCGAYFLIREG